MTENQAVSKRGGSDKKDIGCWHAVTDDEKACGDVYATAMCALMLEVCYRFERVAGAPWRGSRAQPVLTAATKKPGRVEKMIPLIGSKMSAGKWKRKSIAVASGATVTVRAITKGTIKKIGYSHHSFAVRIARDGPAYWFDTHAWYNYWHEKARKWIYQPELRFTADRAGDLHIAQNQENRFELSIVVEP